MPEITGTSGRFPNADSPEAIEMYAALGRALTEFNKVETALSSLFASIVEATAGLSAMAAVDGIESVFEKIKLVRGAIWSHQLNNVTNTSPFHLHLLRIEKALVELEYFAKFRNFLAHSTLMEYSLSIKDQPKETILLFVPMGTGKSKNIGWLRRKALLRLCDVHEIVHAFEVLVEHLHRLAFIFSFMRVGSEVDLEMPELPARLKFKNLHDGPHAKPVAPEGWFEGK